MRHIYALPSQSPCILYYRKAVRPEVMRNHGIYLPVDELLSDNICQFLYAQKYENREVQIIKKRLEPCARTLEFGTGIGFVTALSAKIY